MLDLFAFLRCVVFYSLYISEKVLRGAKALLREQTVLSDTGRYGHFEQALDAENLYNCWYVRSSIFTP